MMLNFITKLLGGTKSERDIKKIFPYVQLINAEYEKLQSFSNDELRAKTTEFKERIFQYLEEEENKIKQLKEQISTNPALTPDDKENVWQEIDQVEEQKLSKTEYVLTELLPEAFAVMKETARRFKENDILEVTANEFDKQLSTRYDSINIKGEKAYYQNEWMAGGSMIKWDMVHYDVQLIGGVVLHQGKIAEMATGEGKTLVATLPVYLNALAGKGVHLVTVNSYLARRDAEWMGMLYQFHGLRTDCIDNHNPNTQERRAAYQADVTYGTNNEFGFDYLRDNMVATPDEMVQRKHHFSIVDEVDSVLIDDARTPLIISGPTQQDSREEFNELKPIVAKLVDVQRKLVTKLLTEAKKMLKEGQDEKTRKKGAENLFRAYRGLPKNKALIKYLSEPGIKALMQKTEALFMQEQGKHMHIIDDELYFVIDEKQNTIDLTDKGIDLIHDITGNSDFYILPDIGSEIADLEKSELSDKEKMKRKSEMLQDYAVKSDRVHSLNQLFKAYTLFEIDIDYVVMDNKVKIVDEQTGRILEGRRYSDGLHQAIEAKENVKIEASTQTYATVTLQNYFRMYHKLSGMTGTAETEAGEFFDIYELDVVVIPTNKPVVRKDYQDLVYKTKTEKYNAVIEVIEQYVKAGRPVLVGTTSVEISELLSRMLNRMRIKHNVLNAKLHQREAQVVAEAGQPGNVTIATNMAGRGTDIKLGKGVIEAGGLAIIGTERHDSRRVDRQLRGRAGRQGDPGSSQFFVSLEDDLMRLFGSERISKVMDRLGYEKGEVIQHKMITNSIERAQRKVEENNFGIRKRLLEYDDVMNAQREVIYQKRRHALFGERLSIDIANMIYDITDNMVRDYQDAQDYQGLKMELFSQLAIEIPFDEKEFLAAKAEEMIEKVYDLAYQNYQEKFANLAKITYPVIRSVYKDPSVSYKNIAIPISDGAQTMQIVADMEDAYQSEGKSVITSIEKGVSMKSIDNAWKEHLREMDELKQSVQNATYEQKDPLLIYKFESYGLFKAMLSKVNKEIISFLLRAHLPEQEEKQDHREILQEASLPKGTDLSNLKTSRTDMGEVAKQQTSQKETTQPRKVEKKVGRNDPCPCGSGKKYKHCHGKPGVESA
ncbi:MAG: preprotein translocase subunit SecA [Bacteroidales bacterium]